LAACLVVLGSKEIKEIEVFLVWMVSQELKVTEDILARLDPRVMLEKKETKQTKDNKVSQD